MRKRLRKKLRRREFQELGFELSFLIGHDRNELMERFVAEAIEANGLRFGGSDSGGFVTSATPRASATEEDRGKVRGWLEAQPEVKEVAIAELRDACHGWSWSV